MKHLIFIILAFLPIVFFGQNNLEAVATVEEALSQQIRPVENLNVYPDKITWETSKAKGGAWTFGAIKKTTKTVIYYKTLQDIEVKKWPSNYGVYYTNSTNGIRYKASFKSQQMANKLCEALKYLSQ